MEFKLEIKDRRLEIKYKDCISATSLSFLLIEEQAILSSEFN